MKDSVRGERENWLPVQITNAMIYLRSILFLFICTCCEAKIYIAGFIDTTTLEYSDGLGGTLTGSLSAVILRSTEPLVGVDARTQYTLQVGHNGGASVSRTFRFADQGAGAFQASVRSNQQSAFLMGNFSNLGFPIRASTPRAAGLSYLAVYDNGVLADEFGIDNTTQIGTGLDFAGGFVYRTNATSGAFDINNYSVQAGALDGVTEAEAAALLGPAFNDFDASIAYVPEPSPTLLSLVGGLFWFARRRRS